MSEDYLRTNNSEIAYILAYSNINELLKNEGRSLSDFPTMEQSVISTSDYNNSINLEEKLEIGKHQYNQFNREQADQIFFI